MRGTAAFLWNLILMIVAGLAAWSLGLGHLVESSIRAGRLLDWVMGAVCFFWLILILKAPWDLYFQAHTVAFELQRSQEQGMVTALGRESYVRTLQQRLLALALSAHVVSAVVVAVATHFSGGEVGYYFAGFYLVSTAFRPAVAGYVYLSRKLSAIGQEAKYPHDNIVELRARLKRMEGLVDALQPRMDSLQQELQQEAEIRSGESREIRGQVHAISREFETTISRLTDNQEVIKGIGAFVRLISQARQA